ncbi:hypothetical protein CPB86DRAFT_786776 [Serendipita vermifera]|nr:hypothetical protein CPB86DRAFT_786776 [Serendipita vermifera]
MFTTDPHLIAVLGPTGTGKSTFINLASGAQQGTNTGLRCCTSNVEATNPFFLQEQPVVLLDTPGFDNIVMGDTDILAELENYVNKTYKKKLTGILYFHDITATRVANIALRHSKPFEKLCGENPFQSLVVVTNMWDSVEQSVAENREKELRTDAAFFKRFVERGAIFRRHTNTEVSSHEIILSLLARKSAAKNSSTRVETVVDNLTTNENSAIDAVMHNFNVLIENLDDRIKRDEKLVPQNKELEITIKRMKAKVKELEIRKKSLQKSGSIISSQMWSIAFAKLSEMKP